MFLKRLFGRSTNTKAPAAALNRLTDALQSEDVSERRNACRQLADLSLLRGLADGDKDAGVRELAEARYRRLLCGLDASAPSLETRLEALAQAEHPGRVHQVATQAADAALRLAAIERVEDAEVLAVCATADEVARNRLAALERVHQREALERIIRQSKKRDKRVYRLARERLRQIAEQAERPRRARELGDALCERLSRLGRFNNWTQDRALLEHIQQQWATIDADVEDALRARFQALRDAFLAADAAHQAAEAADAGPSTASATDGAPGRQQQLLAQMQQLAARAQQLDQDQLETELKQLQRAWEAATTPDTAISPSLSQAYREAQRTLEQQREQRQAGDHQDQAIERLLSDLRRWDERQDGLPAELDLERLRRRRNALAEVTPASHRAAPVGAEADTETGRTEDAAPGVSAGPNHTPADRTDPRLAEIDQRLTALAQRRDRQQRQLKRKVNALTQRLRQLEQHLGAGELKKADAIYQSVSATLEHARGAGADAGPGLIAAAEAKLKEIAPQLRELRQWRRWSSDEHRATLCAQIEALAEDEAMADEPRVNRLRELKDQWQRLDQQGAPAEDALWQRFRQAADRIRERAQPYLDTQAALRQENRKQREAFAQQLEAFLDKVDWERVDWKKLHRAAREMRQGWTRLITDAGSNLRNPRDRAIEGRFRRAMRRLERPLSEERERNRAHKQRLLAEMQALAEAPDLRQAVEQAKRLQQQWRTTVPGRHRDENALWQQFRAASDAIFARRNAEHEAHGANLRANLEQREAICRALAALASQDAAAPAKAAALEQAISELKTRWNQTEALPIPRQAQTSLSQHWREALAAVRARLVLLRDAERWAGLERLAQRADYCDRAAQRLLGTPSSDGSDCEALERGWASLPAIEDRDAAAALTEAYAAINAACLDGEQRDTLTARQATNAQTRESLCLSLEIAAQIESPPQLREQRMQRQVERLRGRMGDTNESDQDSERADDLDTLLRAWYLATPATPSSELNERFARVKSALHEGAAGTGQVSP